MFVPVESLSASTRVWIYQADRQFSAVEAEAISKYLHAFCEKWVVHGQPLPTSFEIRFQQFIILYVDEAVTMASGCSIDSSVRVIKQIEAEYSVNLLRRDLIAFLGDDGIRLVPMADLKEFFASGTLNERSETFNLLAATKAQLEQEWILPAGKTWLRRYLSGHTVKT